MAEIDRDMCRKAAAECVDLARSVVDPVKKDFLLARAQEWLKLAYSKSDTEFEQHLALLNTNQMEGHGPALVQRVPMQQQPSSNSNPRPNQRATSSTYKRGDDRAS
jgi:hypothetical protein